MSTLIIVVIAALAILAIPGLLIIGLCIAELLGLTNSPEPRKTEEHISEYFTDPIKRHHLEERFQNEDMYLELSYIKKYDGYEGHVKILRRDDDEDFDFPLQWLVLGEHEELYMNDIQSLWNRASEQTRSKEQ